MKKIFEFVIILVLLLSINHIGYSQLNKCDGPFDVQLLSGGTIDDILYQLGINTLDELCNYPEQYSMVIGGTLLLDSPGNEVCFDGVNIKMLKDAKIKVEHNTILSLNSVDIYGCDEMWLGIELNSTTINVTGYSTIEDAHNGILIYNKSKVNLNNTTFRNNETGIRMYSFGGSGDLNISGCSFISDGDFIGKYGIFMEGQDYIIIDGGEGNENLFENLDLGVFVWHSKARIENCIFKNIHGSGYNGNGVKILNRPHGGDGVSTVSNNKFIDVDCGIVVDFERIVARYNEMEDVEMGIWLNKCDNIELFHNVIEASEIGVKVNSCKRFAPYAAFESRDNKITVSGNNQKAKGINIQSSDDFGIIENEITMHSNEAGIFVRESDNVLIQENTISVQGLNGINTNAIKLESSRYLEVIENDMKDYGPGCDGENNGIYSITSFGNFACNKTEDFKRGIDFFNDCDNSTLDGNKFYNNARDLVLGNAAVSAETVIGIQGDFDELIGWGNRWLSDNGGTAYNYSSALFVDDSKFLINSFADPTYKPALIVAATNSWFRDDVFVTNESLCSDGSGGGSNPDTIKCEDVITSILKIDSSQVLDDCKKAMWKYRYYKKLLVLKKKNLLVGDCFGFLDNQSDSLLIQVAEVDTAITNILVNQSVDFSTYSDLKDAQSRVDDLYDADQINTPEWDEAMTQYSQLLMAYVATMENEKATDGQRVDSVKNVIDNISVSDSCLKVLLKTFKVELDYIKSDSLTPDQMVYMKEVAESCPSEIGDGVYLARSIMSRYENARYRSVEECGVPMELMPRGMEDNRESELQIYPNPTSDMVSIYIDISKDEIGELTLVDVQGKVLRSLMVNEAKNKFILNVNDLVNGIYFVKYKSNKGLQQLKKLIVSK